MMNVPVIYTLGRFEFFYQVLKGHLRRARCIAGYSCPYDSEIHVSISETFRAATAHGLSFEEELNQTIDHEFTHILAMAPVNDLSDEKTALVFERAGAWARR